MNSELRVHTHSTSTTRVLPFSRYEQRSYSVAPQRAGRSQTLTTELIQLNSPRLLLRCPIPVNVSWTTEMQCYLAIDYVFHWHGQGDSVQDALQDLADVIVEDYDDLYSWPGELSQPLQERLATMKRYFEDAR